MQKKNKKRRFSNITKRWQLYLMIAPALIWLILFCYKPMYGAIIAFKEYNFKLGILGSKWIGFKNFQRLFATYTFKKGLINTLTLSILGLVVGFPFPIIFALAINELQSEKRKNFLKTISYAPHFISTAVMCGILIMFLNPSNGIANHIIRFFGGERIVFMQEPSMFKWIYVLSGVWQNAGWNAIIYFSALASVDKEVLEAASIDGANRFQKVLYINIPYLVPVIAILLTLDCGNLLSIGYEKVLLLQNSANLSASEVISTFVYKVGLEKFDYSLSTAAGLFNSVCNSIILVLANIASKKMTNSSLW